MPTPHEQIRALADAMSPSKLTDWASEPTVNDLKKDLTAAQSAHSTQTSKVSGWLDSLHVRGEAKLKKARGKSTITPKLIRKQAEWRYAALSEPFLSQPNLFKTSPATHADTLAARQSGAVLNYQFNSKINRIHFIDSLVRSCVNEGTAIIRVGWAFEEREVEVEEEIPLDLPAGSMGMEGNAGGMEALLAAMGGMPPPEASMMPPEGTMPPPPEAGLPGMEGALPGMEGMPPDMGMGMPPPEAAMPPDMGMSPPPELLNMGMPPPMEPVRTRMVKKTVIVKNHPTVEVCNYDAVIVDPTCNGDLSKASFVIFKFETSMSDLEKSGRYKNLDRINLDSGTVLASADSGMYNETGFFFNDKPRKKLLAYEYWGFWDKDGKGKTSPFVATWVGDTKIRMEDSPFPDGEVPFVFIPYLPVKNSVYGEPDGELLEDNQKIIGAVTRGMIDVMGRSANGQIGIRQDALDVTNARRFDMGLDYKFQPHIDPRQAFFTHTFPEIPMSAQFMLQMQNMEAESISGVKSFSGGITGDALGATATGAKGAMDAKAQREMGILRRLAEGLKVVGRKICAMNAEFLSEEEVIRITDEEFVQVNRDDLAGNYDVLLDISSAEVDNVKAQELSFMLQTVGNGMPQEFTQMILADIARLRKMPELAKKIETFQAQPDPVAQKMQELEVAKLEAEIQAIQAKAAMDGSMPGLNAAKARLAEAQADGADLDFVEQESGVHQERNLQMAGAQARANAEMKEREAQAKKETELSKALINARARMQK